jgi:hypothetical protein
MAWGYGPAFLLDFPEADKFEVTSDVGSHERHGARDPGK